MKKCPFCKAEIEENARFCLYCMTPLEEKQTIEKTEDKPRRWVYFLIASALALVVVGALILIIKGTANIQNLPGGTSSNIKADYENQLSALEPNDNSSSNTSSKITVGKEPSVTTGDNNSTYNSSQTKLPNATGKAQTTTGTTAELDNTLNQNTANNNDKSNVNNQNDSSDQTGSNSQIDGNDQSSEPNLDSSEEPIGTPSYTYITATTENTYPPWYQTIYSPQNAVVITKVGGGIPDGGNYVIPETIDGKRVTAIMPSAFADVASSVKSVTVPSKVKTIWTDAFKNCYNLTDLYIKSNSIEIYLDALPEASKRNGTLTFHCSKECMNYNFYYYRNIAGNFGAVYDEWNG